MVYSYENAPRLLKNFLTQKLTIEGRSEKTVQEYYYDLNAFFRYILKQKGWENREIDLELVKAIELNDLYDYLMYLSTHRKNNARTRARKLSSIKSFYKYLHVKMKLIEENPAAEIDSPKVVRTLPRYLELSESRRLLSAVSGRNQERDFAILTLFLNCGLRLSEVVGINLSDIKGDTLRVMGKGKKERIVFLNDACQAAIEGYLKVRPKEGLKDPEALFISSQRQRIYYKTVQYLVKKYIKAAGLDPAKYSTHKLRHTAATLMYQYGKVDVKALQEILGHEQLNTTQIYTHVNRESLREAMKANPLADFKPE